MDEVVPKMARRRGSDAGQSRRPFCSLLTMLISFLGQSNKTRKSHPISSSAIRKYDNNFLISSYSPEDPASADRGAPEIFKRVSEKVSGNC